MSWRSGCNRCRLVTHCVIAVLAFVLTACMAADRVPDADVTKAYRRILVVPMESPLFTISSAVSEDFRTILGYTAIGNIFGLIAGIIVVTAEGDNVDKDARYAEYEAALSKQIWNPPVILAHMAAARIDALGSHGATTIDDIQPLPTTNDRTVVLDINEWLPPANAWYALEVATFDPTAAIPGDADAVLQVALYQELAFGSYYHIRLYARLVDAGTRQVVGRTVVVRERNGVDPDSLFAEDARAYKALVIRLTDGALEEALANLCLRPCQ